MTLNFAYGTPRITANVSLNANLNGLERRGHYMSSTGPDIATAYLALTPAPIGRLQLHLKAGAFRENYGGPGQWGWGVNGPLIGVKGYGESMSGEYPLTSNTRLVIGQGIMATPTVPEDFVRGDPVGWVEVGRGTWVHHWHLGLSYKNQYVVKVHAASALGVDERRDTPEDLRFVADNQMTRDVWEPARDGFMNAYVLELRGIWDPWGQLGVSVAYWRMGRASSVHDGIFWGLEWTAGGREMGNNYLGPGSDGTGQIAAISAEYSLSIARILWYPRPFDGRAPDVQLKLGVILHRTLESDDPAFDGTNGYNLGPQAEYLMLPWFALNMRVAAINRPYSTGRYQVGHVTTAAVFRQDWQSRDRIELAYSRMFYNDMVDNNPAEPMDRDIVTLGAVMSF
jgi:hypothetical protein